MGTHVSCRRGVFCASFLVVLASFGKTLSRWFFEYNVFSTTSVVTTLSRVCTRADGLRVLRVACGCQLAADGCFASVNG